jgi:hypothetical protein
LFEGSSRVPLRKGYKEKIKIKKGREEKNSLLQISGSVSFVSLVTLA